MTYGSEDSAASPGHKAVSALPVNLKTWSNLYLL
jgi:hypothetical protein